MDNISACFSSPFQFRSVQFSSVQCIPIRSDQVAHIYNISDFRFHPNSIPATPLPSLFLLLLLLLPHTEKPRITIRRKDRNRGGGCKKKKEKSFCFRRRNFPFLSSSSPSSLYPLPRPSNKQHTRNPSAPHYLPLLLLLLLLIAYKKSTNSVPPSKKKSPAFIKSQTPQPRSVMLTSSQTKSTHFK